MVIKKFQNKEYIEDSVGGKKQYTLEVTLEIEQMTDQELGKFGMPEPNLQDIRNGRETLMRQHTMQAKVNVPYEVWNDELKKQAEVLMLQSTILRQIAEKLY